MQTYNPDKFHILSCLGRPAHLRGDAIVISHTVGRLLQLRAVSVLSNQALGLSWSSLLDCHTSQRGINSRFELHDGLKPIYSMIINCFLAFTPKRCPTCFFFLSRSTLFPNMVMTPAHRLRTFSQGLGLVCFPHSVL